jgi:hypothetical protein
MMKIVKIALAVVALSSGAKAQNVAVTTPSSSETSVIPMVFFINNVEVKQVQIGGANGPEFYGIVRVSARVRNSEDTPLKLKPIFPPTTLSGEQVATLDLVAQAVPSSSDLCVFTSISTIFSYQSKVALGRVRVRAAGNALTVNGEGAKGDNFIAPNCAGTVGLMITPDLTEVTSALGSTKKMVIVGPADPVPEEMQANPNRASLYTDESGKVTAVVWQ